MPAHEGADAATPPVLGTSNNWRKQFHTEVSCALDGPRRVDNPRLAVRPAKCTKEQEKPSALQIAHCHDPEKSGVSSFGRTSASTWSPCPNGVQNTRIQCSQVDNDWSPLHTITGRMALLPASTICSQPTGKTPAWFHNCVFPDRAWSHKADSTCACKKPCALGHQQKDVIQEGEQQQPGECLEAFELTEGEQNWHEKIVLCPPGCRALLPSRPPKCNWKVGRGTAGQKGELRRTRGRSSKPTSLTPWMSSQMRPPRLWAIVRATKRRKISPTTMPRTLVHFLNPSSEPCARGDLHSGELLCQLAQQLVVRQIAHQREKVVAGGDPRRTCRHTFLASSNCARTTVKSASGLWFRTSGDGLSRFWWPPPSVSQ